MSNRNFYLTLAGITAAFLVGVYGFNNGWFQPAEPPKVAKNDPLPSPLKPTKEQIEKEDLVEIGGVFRKRSDLEKRVVKRPENLEQEGFELTKRIGQIPAVDANENVYTQSVAEALANPEKYPERLSISAAPKPFDKEAFKKEPEKYLSTIEPGRVFQDLHPREGVNALERVSPGFVKMLQGESVKLQAKGNAGDPVSFHVKGLGIFHRTKLKTITTVFDKDGIATVNFKATKGANGLVKVVAASPTMSNRVFYFMNVSLPSGNSTP